MRLSHVFSESLLSHRSRNEVREKHMMPVKPLMRIGCAILLGSLAAFTSAAAQTPPKVCMDEPAFRQFFEQKNPESGEWQVWFDGRYQPRT